MAFAGSGIEETFHNELVSFKFMKPGNQTIPFSANEVLLDWAQKQYPRWKEKNNVSSAPVARIPKLFLDDSQLENDLQKKIKYTLGGEEVEKKLYSFFVNAFSESQPGILIFPNFDSSHIFKTQGARVEIDMILAHPHKGLFVFNVKNINRGPSVQSIQTESEKHGKFLRMLENFQSVSLKKRIPLYSVVCDFANPTSSRYTGLKEKMQPVYGDTLVFNKNELKENTFLQKWYDKLAAIKDVEWEVSFDILIAQLIALTSIESAAVLIADKLKKGLLQSVSKSKHLASQLKNQENNDVLGNIVAENSKIELPKRNAFILWTKDQMSVIAEVYKHLTTESTNGEGLRLLVTGGKGTGKTILLVHLAKMSQSLLEVDENAEATMKEGNSTIKNDNSSQKILVCHGNPKCRNLTRNLAEALDGIAVEVKDIRKETFHQEVKGIKLLLCDEAKDSCHERILENLNPSQHCVLFTSEKKRYMNATFKHIHLKTCLRATSQLTFFANSYHDQQLKDVFISLPSQTFLGEPVDVRFADGSQFSESPGETEFSEKCLQVLIELGNSQHNDCLVVPFVTKKFLRHILTKLQSKFSIYVDPLLRTKFKNTEKSSRSNERDIPHILFSHPLSIEGCEFTKVIVLLDLKQNVLNFEDDHFFSAITRATVQLTIIVKDFEVANYENWYQKKLVKFFRRTLSNVVGQVPGNTDQPTVLFVGQLLSFIKPSSNYERVDPNSLAQNIPQVAGVSLYKGPDGRYFLQVDDVYLESDFEKLKEFGVKQVVFINDSFSCIWQYFFKAPSYWCCLKYTQQIGKCFSLREFCGNVHEISFQVQLRKNILRRFSGIRANIAFQDYWLNFRKCEIPPQESPNWEKWEWKANEILRKGFTALALVFFDCTIKLLPGNIEFNIGRSNWKTVNMERNHFGKLTARVSEIYRENILCVIKESNCSYWIPNVHWESCLLRALKYSINAAEGILEDLSCFDGIDGIIRELKAYSSNESFKKIVAQLNAEDKSGIKSSNRFRPEINDSSNKMPQGFHAKFSELETLISDYEMKNFDKNSAHSLKATISQTARELADESIEVLSKLKGKSQCDTKETISRIGMIIEYPLQLMMTAVHWEYSTESNRSLTFAIDELEQFVNQLKNQKYNLLCGNSHPVSSSGNQTETKVEPKD